MSVEKETPQGKIKIEYSAKGCELALKSINKLMSRLEQEIREEKANKKLYTPEEFKKSGLKKDEKGKIKFPKFFDMYKCFHEEVKGMLKMYEDPKETRLTCDFGIYRILVYIEEKYKRDSDTYAEGLYYLSKYFLLRSYMLVSPTYSVKKYNEYRGLLEKSGKFGVKLTKYLDRIEETYKNIKNHDENWKISKLIKRAMKDKYVEDLGKKDYDPSDYDYDYDYSSSYSSSSSESSYSSSDGGYSSSESRSNGTVFTDIIGREVAHTDDGGYRVYDDCNRHIGYKSGNKIYDENFDPVGFISDNGQFHKY